MVLADWNVRLRQHGQLARPLPRRPAALPVIRNTRSTSFTPGSAPGAGRLLADVCKAAACCMLHAAFCSMPLPVGFRARERLQTLLNRWSGNRKWSWRGRGRRCLITAGTPDQESVSFLVGGVPADLRTCQPGVPQRTPARPDHQPISMRARCFLSGFIRKFLNSYYFLQK